MPYKIKFKATMKSYKKLHNVFPQKLYTVHFLQFPMYCAEIRGLEIRRFGNCRIAYAETLKFVMSKGREFSVEF